MEPNVGVMEPNLPKDNFLLENLIKNGIIGSLIKMWKFIKFYFSNVIRTIWSILFTLPFAILGILEGANDYKWITLEVKDQITIWLSHSWWWILLVVFWILNVRAIYRLSQKTELTGKSTGQNILSDTYEDLAKKMDKLVPEKSIEVREIFGKGEKYLNDSGKERLATTKHFEAYRIVKDSLDKQIEDGKIGQITVEMVEMKSRFLDNYSQIKKYNDDIGCNKDFILDKYALRKLIEQINENLNGFFSNIDL